MVTLTRFLLGAVAALVVLVFAHIDPALAQEAAARRGGTSRTAYRRSIPATRPGC